MTTILVVEDEAFIRHDAEWTIGDLGHVALAASDLDGALSHLRSPTSIDALFVDIRLGGLALGGYAVADQAIQIQPALRVLYTSGTSLTDEMSERFVAGGQFLQKPYSPTDLAASLDELFRSPPTVVPAPPPGA